MAQGMSTPAMSGEMQRCIDECTHCHAHCVNTTQYCLKQGGMHAEASHIRLLIDCAQICQLTGDILIRSSDFHIQLCRVCADACERCAQDCERFDKDETMKSCAEACRSCTDACHQMEHATV